jgi:hypothetical protein
VPATMARITRQATLLSGQEMGTVLVSKKKNGRE